MINRLTQNLYIYIYIPKINLLTQKLFIKIDSQLHVATKFSHPLKDYNYEERTIVDLILKCLNF